MLFPSSQLFLISGPCAVEDYDSCAKVAEVLCKLREQIPGHVVFKGSFRKANRTRSDSFAGIGDEAAIHILGRIKEEFDLMITTDVHQADDVAKVMDIVDVIQIPAFLCRQTALIQRAAKTGKTVNIKKGQFMSGEGMKYAKQKAEKAGEGEILLTERGTTFGYSDLIVDMRNIAAMTAFATVVMDCTHATQRPNSGAGVTGGNPLEIELLARTGLMAGATGLFIETHPDPASASSDQASMLPLRELEPMIKRLLPIAELYQATYGSND
ncbi:MAG: 3-deoxy-8-phosphooctulonate synthase [Bacteroidota bacterium]